MLVPRLLLTRIARDSLADVRGDPEGPNGRWEQVSISPPAEASVRRVIVPLDGIWQLGAGA